MGVDGKRRWAEAAQELDRHPQALPLPRRSIASEDQGVREDKGISKEDAIIISIRIHLGMGRLGEEQTNTCARAKRTRGRKAHRGREQGGRARARELESEREREGERGSKHHAYKY